MNTYRWTWAKEHQQELQDEAQTQRQLRQVGIQTNESTWLSVLGPMVAVVVWLAEIAAKNGPHAL